MEPGDATIRVSSGILKSEVVLPFLPDLRPLIAAGILEGPRQPQQVEMGIDRARALARRIRRGTEIVLDLKRMMSGSPPPGAPRFSSREKSKANIC
jgi:hypothetical protein